MKIFESKLWDKGVPMFDENAAIAEQNLNTNVMTVYLVEAPRPVPTIVIFPGGGYSQRAPHEGAAVAQYYAEQGINAVVVNYRVKPYCFPVPLLDAQRAIKLVRYHAKEWNIDADRVYTLGFSAGGHLCSMTATMDDICHEYNDAVDKMSAKPNGAILCYAVISSKEKNGHLGSFQNLLGDRYEAEKDSLSTEDLVNEKTCPCFIWHTAEDTCVPMLHSYAFSEKLREHKVPFEMHIYPRGQHGIGMAEGRYGVSDWPRLTVKWIRHFFA